MHPCQLRAAFSGHGPKKSNLYLEGIKQKGLSCAILILIAHQMEALIHSTKKTRF
jgi:hypothetical protein